jgi:hypothetical protein
MACLVIERDELRGGANKRKSLTYSLHPQHFTEKELDLFKESELAYKRIGHSVKQVSKGDEDVIVHLTPDKDLRKLYPTLKHTTKLSLTDRGKTPMHIHLHLDNWLGIPKSSGSEYKSLRDYRIALINHEFSHVLGHDHVSCAGYGEESDVRQQPSRALGGCLPTTRVILNPNSPASSVNF